MDFHENFRTSQILDKEQSETLLTLLIDVYISWIRVRQQHYGTG